MNLRKAKKEDIDVLENLYDEVNDYLAENINYPGWKKGVYPIRKDAEDGFDSGALYVATENEEIIGTIILNSEYPVQYDDVKWNSKLKWEEVLVVHTFAVSPKTHSKGVGYKMLKWVEDYARSSGYKAIRLDTYEINDPASALYKKCGYEHMGTISLGMEQFGLDWYKVFELVL